MQCRTLVRRCVCGGLCSLAFLLGAQAAAQDAPAIRHISGGIGVDERRDLQEQQGQYNFWLRTAIQRSGAYLSAVKVRITDLDSKKVVLEHTLDGPWLLANLPPGRYTLEARYRSSAAAPEQVLRQTTEVRPGSQRQMMLYFEGTDEVGNGNGNGLPHASRPAEGSK